MEPMCITGQEPELDRPWTQGKIKYYCCSRETKITWNNNPLYSQISISSSVIQEAAYCNGKELTKRTTTGHCNIQSLLEYFLPTSPLKSQGTMWKKKQKERKLPSGWRAPRKQCPPVTRGLMCM